MKILVTGALGFVGVSLVRELAEEGTSFIVAADLRQGDGFTSRFLAPVEQNVETVRLDVRDRDAVHRLIDEASITHILHAAAITPTEEQERTQPTHIVDVNLGGVINVLDAAMKSESVERVLTVSSSGVYGAPVNPRYPRQPEEGPLSLDNLYSMTKYSAELLTRRYGQLSGKPMASVRFGPIYGPMESPSASRQRISQPGKLLTAIRKKHAVTVSGSSVQCDWTHTADIGRAIWAILKAPQWRHSLYNVSSGVAVSFGQVVDVCVALGLSATWVADATQADVAMVPSQERLPMDIRRLQNDTGFEPRYDLAEGLALCLDI